jgi:hypothetical protein
MTLFRCKKLEKLSRLFFFQRASTQSKSLPVFLSSTTEKFKEQLLLGVDDSRSSRITPQLQNKKKLVNVNTHKKLFFELTKQKGELEIKLKKVQSVGEKKRKTYTTSLLPMIVAVTQVSPTRTAPLTGEPD